MKRDYGMTFDEISEAIYDYLVKNRGVKNTTGVSLDWRVIGRKMVRVTITPHKEEKL